MQRNQASAMVRSLEGTLNNSPTAKPPMSCAQSAPGSRGGSSLGYSSEHQVPVSAINSVMTRSMEGPQSLPLSSGSPHHTLDRRYYFMNEINFSIILLTFKIIISLEVDFIVVQL